MKQNIKYIIIVVIIVLLAIVLYARFVQHHKSMKQNIQTEELQAWSAAAKKNQFLADEFFVRNRLNKGVVTLSNGLQYKIITQGEGVKPTMQDTVVVDYEGKHLNGTIFDSSYKRGKPATFPLNRVVKGWQEGISHMPVGSTWMLYIPPRLAYGYQGYSPVIAPNEALIFKVHLRAIKK